MSSFTKQQIHLINPLADRALRDNDLWRLDFEPLNSHLWEVGASGVGKTAVTTDAILFPLFYQGRPCIVMDPVGTLSRRLVWRIGHYPRYLQPYLFNRLVYAARGAPDFVMRTPLYAPKDEHESHYTTANRLIQVIARVDPFLVTASVEGMNAAKTAGTYAGQLAAALKLQVTEVADMLIHPGKWLPRLAQATQADPLLQPAFAYFQQLDDANPAVAARKTGTFLTHVLQFLADPIMRAPYAASGPGLNLDAHVQRGDMILYDYSYISDRDSKLFALLWDFLDTAEWAKRRGIAGREQPCLWCIDEISALTNLHALEHSILGEDINELAAQFARNIGLQLCFISQGIQQLPPAIVTALSQFGTKLVGNLPLLDDALSMAKLLYAYDPYRVKKRNSVWMKMTDPSAPPEVSHTVSASAGWSADVRGSSISETTGRSTHTRPGQNPRVIDETTEEFSLDEQYQLAAQAIQQLPRFHFLIKAASGEGDLTGALRHVSFARLVNGHYPAAALLEAPLADLRRKWGVPVGQLLREIEQRKQQAITLQSRAAPPAAPPAHDHAILKGDDTNHAHPDRPLPDPKRNKHRRRGKRRPAEPPADDHNWQENLWRDSPAGT
jgi:hypothetical protein